MKNVESNEQLLERFSKRTKQLTIRKEELKEEGSKPKKFFRFGGGSGNGAFQQMMRQNMASNNQDKGPKKVDANQYKELQDLQTAKAQ